MLGVRRVKTFFCSEVFLLRLAIKVISWIVIGELVRELLRDCGDIVVKKSWCVREEFWWSLW